MKHITYNTQGTCSRLINIELDDEDRIVDISFVGGCNGNLKGLCALVKGLKAKDVRQRLAGITCKDKPTSCPDQLSCALAEV